MVQLLDEHHVAVLADDPRLRRHFTRVMIEHLRALPETDVVSIDGTRLVDLPSIAGELTRLADRPAGHVERMTIDDVIDLLRDWPGTPHHRYFFWRDADVLLDADVDLFAELVNALFAVAAEREHLNAEPLILQRAILVGNAKLGAYAEDENGQFFRWREDEDSSSPFWEILSCVERPPVITYRLDD